MIIAFGRIRTSTLYKCFKFGIYLESTRNVKLQQLRFGALINFGNKRHSHYSWRIQDFPLGKGVPTLNVGVPTYYYGHFILKTE